VTAVSHCLLVELATMPVLALLTFTLPMRAREESESALETAETGPDPVAARAMVGAGETL
jgi:hypothetical protein